MQGAFQRGKTLALKPGIVSLSTALSIEARTLPLEKDGDGEHMNALKVLTRIDQLFRTVCTTNESPLHSNSMASSKREARIELEESLRGAPGEP